MITNANPILTYNETIMLLRDIAARHFEIKTFSVDMTYDRAINKNVPTPILYVRPINMHVFKSKDADTYPVKEIKLELCVVDLVDTGLSNRDDVHSDTNQILLDILAEINQHPYYQSVGAQMAGDIDATPLYQYTDDDAYGWKTTITLRLKNRTDWCGLPFYPITGFTGTFSGG